MFNTTTLTRCTFALFASGLLAVGCGSSSRPEVTSKNECIIVGDRIFVHALIRANYTTGAIKTSRDLWQLDCRISDKTCKGVSLALDNVDRGHAITMMDLNRLEGAELISVVGSVATIRWGALRTFTVDFDRGRITYVESGEGLGPTEGRGEASCPSTGVPLRAEASEPSSERELQPKAEPTATPPERHPMAAMAVGQAVSCFTMPDMRLHSVSVCAFDNEACKATARRMGITGAKCQPADSMVCNRTRDGLMCFGDMSTCLLKTDSADCVEVRYTP